ncbi:hypothetical protein G7A72_03240 [Flavobacterium sp. Sr18]|uniref:hypothetical protein n=1 Tax=Flavobacterium sp. Sr18 TaxID=935222 RepID=UPI0013E46A26|nr:hypothetical protein [Flavobacterium sp. Sr18]QIH37874.1 hypothetical protein G7A72_03240 [Flavobacterium sp. Sr18]
MNTIIYNSVKLSKNERTILTNIVKGAKSNDKYVVCIEKLAAATGISYETIMNTLRRLTRKNIVRLTNFDRSINNGSGNVQIYYVTEEEVLPIVETKMKTLSTPKTKRITLTEEQVSDLIFFCKETISSDFAEDYHDLFKSLIKKLQ